MSRTPSPPRSFDALVNQEVPGAGAVAERWWIHRTARDLSGIALSGGGIRSATFNLGVLQGLRRLRLLDGFDYVSTVSGGGYLGGFWTRWRSHDPAARAGAFPDSPAERGAEHPSIRHLREFGNFLTPRFGLLTVDTGRAVVAALGGVVPSLLAATSVVVLALLAWLSLASFLAAGGSTTTALAALASVTAAGLLLAEGLTPGEAPRREFVQHLLACIVALGAVLGAWSWLAGAGAAGAVPGPAVLGLPAVAWGAAAAGLLLVRFLFSRVRATAGARPAFERVQSRLWLFAGIWTVAALFWWVGSSLAEWWQSVGTFGVLSAAYAWVHRVISRPAPAKPAEGKRALRLGALAPQILAYAALAAMVVAVAALVDAVQRDTLLALAAAGVTVAALLFYDPGQVGLHAFYRGRLSRAYLGAAADAPDPASDENAADDVDLHALDAADRPFHLVCCAVNDLSDASEPRTLQRGAVSGTLSRIGLGVEKDWCPWTPRGSPTLGAAITASGAAFNSLMGAKTIEFGPASRFLAAALGLRLGLWVPHPRVMETQLPPPPPPEPRKLEVRVDRVVAAPDVEPEVQEAPRPPAVARMLGAAAAAGRAAGRALERLLIGLPFYRELFGAARADARSVHLSDGGHFENLALYELIRRHCRFIVASDCGADPSVAFDDMGNLVRKVRTDFGVDVRIDLAPLRRGADGHARQHMVAGDIHYPNGDTGVLLLFKPALVGDEPADVQQYATRNHAFPHESTVDQFYDEAQWESYRRLGEHAALTAFGTLSRALPDEPRERLARAFSQARFEWLPAPDGFPERAPALGARIAELDAHLAAPACATLRAEVYKELPPAARLAADGSPDGEALAGSLDLVRRAMRILEDAYRTEDLERNGTHPTYLGLLNYFARWMAAPTVRTWWPYLKTLHSHPFVRWVETEYGLRSPGVVPLTGAPRLSLLGEADLRPEGRGLATRCWALTNPLVEDDGRTAISYLLVLDHDGHAHRLQAGQLLCRVENGILAWEAGDFYFPPGLWGSGFGSDFLRLLRDSRETEFLAESQGGQPDTLLVAVQGADGSPTEKKRAADEAQMYRSMGFSEAVVDSTQMLAVDGETTRVPLDAVPRDWIRPGTRWMLAARTVTADDGGSPGTPAYAEA